jgi:hypothetical protein
MGLLAMSEVVPKSATKCAGNLSMNAKFWWGIYIGVRSQSNSGILSIFNVLESLGGNTFAGLQYCRDNVATANAGGNAFHGTRSWNTSKSNPDKFR